MSESISHARNGDPIVSVNGIFLHSRYDPANEAARFVEALSVGKEVGIFLLIEPGLGYLARALREKHPEARILVARCSTFFGSPEARSRGADNDGEWLPDGSCSFGAFLERHISDHEARAVKVVEWKASVGAYGSEALALVSAAAVFLKRAAANARTVASFGRAWFRNAVDLASYSTTMLSILPGDWPVAVVAAGPSLEACLPELRAAQDERGLFVVSVSSALPALAEGNVRVDLTVATDGGGWAAFHLLEAARKQLPTAVALTAALPSALYSAALLPIRDSSRWQRLLSASAGLPSVSAPQRGTVAATAVDLAMALTDGPIYLTGFDLGVSRGRTHARPNALDRFHEDRAERLAPAASAAYSRYLAAKEGTSLRIYAEWLAGKLNSENPRIRVLRPETTALAEFRREDRILESPAKKQPILVKQERGGTDSASRRTAILESLRRSVVDEMALFTQNGADRTDLIEERSLAGELLALFSPEDLARASEGWRRNGIPKSFAIDAERTMLAAIDDLRRETKWTSG